MNIVWQQLATHALGFLLVVWLLKKYAWGPLMAMIDERREKIVSDFREIELQKQDVAQQKGAYEDKLKAIEQERREKLIEGVNEGQKIAAELKSKAHAEAKEIIVRAKAETQRELAKAKVQLKNDMVDLTLAATEKILRERLTAEKDRELVSGYIEELSQA
ncbi:MAG: F0F1 ATP synthase subunit B [candidate division Zixibacteria bacterium]|nr:F0F1 ATP synthase subunit B [candidate division Zixibacteria bacterium]